MFAKEAELFLTCKQMYNLNKSSVRALYWEHCNKAMTIDKIKALTIYESEIKKCPFKLIDVIKELSLVYQMTKYSMAAILDDAIQTFANLRQKEDKLLTDYGHSHTVAKERAEISSGW